MGYSIYGIQQCNMVIWDVAYMQYSMNVQGIAYKGYSSATLIYEA